MSPQWISATVTRSMAGESCVDDIGRQFRLSMLGGDSCEGLFFWDDAGCCLARGHDGPHITTSRVLLERGFRLVSLGQGATP